jgi:crotonobetainyl-CoA:carnitine CoA-transferase CaiB-like acyl-CoA transferase
VSDRHAKHDITPVDPDAILERVASMPISEWSYNDQEPSARHIGPMAQDFRAAFGTGSSDKCIPTIDENGVALAAIQALYRRVERLDLEGRELRRENEGLRHEVERLRSPLRASAPPARTAPDDVTARR